MQNAPVSDLPTSVQFDFATGIFAPSLDLSERRMSDLAEMYYDQAAVQKLLLGGNPVIYEIRYLPFVTSNSDMSLGVTRIFPGKVGDEYFMTKGHLHAWRPAAEFYFGLSGEGVMLLEDEHSGESRVVPLQPNGVVYVPGHAAHRTMNVGKVPLTYIGVYPAKAGHDYRTIAKTNFRCVVVERAGKPVMIERKDFLK